MAEDACEPIFFRNRTLVIGKRVIRKGKAGKLFFTGYSVDILSNHIERF